MLPGPISGRHVSAREVQHSFRLQSVISPCLCCSRDEPKRSSAHNKNRPRIMMLIKGIICRVYSLSFPTADRGQAVSSGNYLQARNSVIYFTFVFCFFPPTLAQMTFLCQTKNAFELEMMSSTSSQWQKGNSRMHAVHSKNSTSFD